MKHPSGYDLAILHVVDAGPHHGRKVRLTRKSDTGIGHDLVFEFDEIDAVEAFVRQLAAASEDAWGERHTT